MKQAEILVVNLGSDRDADMADGDEKCKQDFR